MDKAKLESRIKELEQQKMQAIANVNAVEGALLDCKFWLDELMKKEKEEVKDNCVPMSNCS